MHHIRIVVCIVAGLSALLGAQHAPGTAPHSDTLLNGGITYSPPTGWTLIGKRQDDRSAGYSLEHPRAQIVVSVAPQQADIRRALAPKLAEQMSQAIAAEARKGNIESVGEPVVEDDARFLLRLHDRFRAQGLSGNRVQLFRAVGRNLVNVVTTAFTEDPAEATKIFEIGESVALSVRLSREPDDPRAGDEPLISFDPKPATRPYATTQPAPFQEVRLRIAPPAGWTLNKSGAASGLIATWRDPEDSANLISLVYRPIPREARRDARLRDLAVEQIASGEKPTFEVDGAEPAGQTQTLADPRFVRKTSTDYRSRGNVEFRVTLRQLRVGDGVASITSVALKDKADAVDALADKVAAELRPLSSER